MEKFLKTIVAVSTSILVLFLLEGLFTFGQAFNFAQYDTFSWIVQGFLIILFAAFGALMSLDEKV